VKRMCEEDNMSILSGIRVMYHKIMEKIYWKFGYVYLPEGDTFKNGVGEILTRDQKEYFLKLCDKYMERYDNIGWDGLPFAMWRSEDKKRFLLLIGFWIFVLVLWLYLSITYGSWNGQ
jgi:hypothetical protein